MITLKFYKMEGAGNDFVVIDNREYKFSLQQIIEFTPKLCNRRFGIGADGVLVLQKAQKPEVDYTMIYRNADGSDAGMCGNGARCLVYFAYKHGFSATQNFNVHDNVYEAEVHKEHDVSIHFPVHVSPSVLKINETEFIKADAATEHLAKFVDHEVLSDEEYLVKTGRSIRFSAEAAPKGTNVNFIHKLSENEIELQTYERGVENLTLACGTGALASAIATHFHDEKSEKHASYAIKVKGGTLKASFDFSPESQTYHQLILNGPAHFVFEGSIQI